MTYGFVCCGGRRGIRTLGALLDTPPFQGGTFNHSAILPRINFPSADSSARRLRILYELQIFVTFKINFSIVLPQSPL